MFYFSKNLYGNKTILVLNLFDDSFCSSKNSYGKKPFTAFTAMCKRSVLAKIHMVTKLEKLHRLCPVGSVLAKIHMVTKLSKTTEVSGKSSVLAKIHMVTKHSI